MWATFTNYARNFGLSLGLGVCNHILVGGYVRKLTTHVRNVHNWIRGLAKIVVNLVKFMYLYFCHILYHSLIPRPTQAFDVASDVKASSYCKA